jgi:N-acetylneuraminate synthase
LVDAAADAGADVVKFQTFRADQLVTPTASKADYQIRNTGNANSQFEMLKALEIDEAAHRQILRRCEERGIAFLSTPFDFISLDLLVNGIGLKRLKIGSGDMTNAPILLEIARGGSDLILSTGMATMEEVEESLGVLAFGYTGGKEPGRAAFRTALASEQGRAALQQHVTLLHCTSDYPAIPEEINLSAMDTLTRAFNLPVGFSDHSEGIAVAIAAVGRGAVMIEKHLTLDRNLPGPDHVASIEPADFKAMVSGIRLVERALGDGRKVPMPSESRTIPIARKSLVARREIKRGERFSADTLTVKRPGTGVSPVFYWEYLGRAATRDYQAEDIISDSR